MKRLTTFVVSAAVVGLMAASTLNAGPYVAAPEGKAYKEYAPVEEPERWWGAELSAGYDSKYIFRGVNIGDNLSWFDLSFSAYGFSGGVWVGNLWGGDYTEVDTYISYTMTLGPVDLTGGWIGYYFDNFNDTHEFFIGADVTSIPYVTPSLYYYHDFVQYDGGWLELKLAASIPVYQDIISIDPFWAISWDFKYNSNSNDWNSTGGGIEVPIALSDNITLTGYGAVNIPMQAIDDVEDTEWYGGASITFSF